MAKQTINLGAAPTGVGGDTPRSAFTKAQDNFDEIYQNFFQRSNIVGAVSQSGGVPTGAIVETGSNANGTYVKYADGTMICHRRLSITTPIPNTNGQLFYASISAVSYAATFVGPTPTCQLSSEDNNGLTWATFGSGVTLAVFPSFFMMAPVSVVSRGYTVNMIAIGRWF